MSRYIGISYPRFLSFAPILWLWKRICCKRGWHLFDECESTDWHHLVCDACDNTLPLYDHISNEHRDIDQKHSLIDLDLADKIRAKDIEEKKIKAKQGKPVTKGFRIQT